MDTCVILSFVSLNLLGFFDLWWFSSDPAPSAFVPFPSLPPVSLYSCGSVQVVWFQLFFPVCFLVFYFYVFYLLKLQDLIILCFGEMLPTVSIWRELCSNSCLDILLPMLGLSSADMWWVKLNITVTPLVTELTATIFVGLAKKKSDLSSCHVGMWRTAVCRKTFVADLQSATVLRLAWPNYRPRTKHWGACAYGRGPSWPHLDALALIAALASR